MQMAAMPACTVPGMVPEFWPAVVRQESHYDPFALRDDTAGMSFYPDNAASAEELATRLMGMGHSVGVGLSQLTATSEAQFEGKFGIPVRKALIACDNMHVGAQFYVNRALSIYNTGSPTKGAAYAASVTARIGVVDNTPARPVIPDAPPADSGMHDAVHRHRVPPANIQLTEVTQ